MGTPRQLGKAIAAAVVLAGAGGVVAGILVGLARGMLGIIVGYAAGIAMGDVVVRAAEGNRGARFRHVAMFGAAALVAIMWQVAIGGLVPAGLGILAYAAAIYAVSTRFP